MAFSPGALGCLSLLGRNVMDSLLVGDSIAFLQEMSAHKTTSENGHYGDLERSKIIYLMVLPMLFGRCSHGYLGVLSDTFTATL